MSRSRFRRHALIAVPSVVLLAGLAACGGSDGSTSSAAGTSDAASSTFVWTMVTDQAGLGDKGFNDLAKAGIDASAKDLGGTAQVLQSSEQAQYVTNLQQAVTSGATVTTGVGFLLADAMAEVAQDNPDSKFTLIDSTVAGDDKKPLSNVAGVTFREQEASFLAGIVAAKTTKTKKIGFVGGIEIPSVVRFLSGFQAGVETVDPSIKITTAYVGNFTDTAVAKELATGFYDDGNDIVFEVAGGAALSVYSVAKSLGPDHWVIGTDTCKDALAPDNYLTSATKDVAGAVVRENTAAAKGTFQGGDISLGLKEDAVGLCTDTYDSLPGETKTLVESAKKAIAAGTITPPGTAAEVKTFTVPTL